MCNLADCRVKLIFNNSVLVRKSFPSLYNSSILNLYIVYKLNACSANPTNNSPLKNCLFGTLKQTRNVGKSELNHNGWGIALDEGFWSFDNDYAKNVVIFAVDYSSSSHNYNRKK